MLRRSSIISGCACVLLLIAGCAKRASASSVFKGIDLKTLVSGRVKSFDYADHTALVILPQYATASQTVLLNMPESEHDGYLAKILTESSNRISYLNGRIVGGSKNGNYGEQEIMYETKSTVGWISITGLAINSTNLYIRAAITECKR
jgi:hypothetical protein